ncbi:1-(5-phosphoribosyl)-5-[(5-phosphoribosylamino)methylideneamino]imidazole-4-carboxamide isomerase [Firmicutes bacterium M10-2]|nr:1-(5-phosphoribosyl)-5-[(5-phosphoribosylamino)methylideneamino]imidazole-4-carboxamide isomerase [Firmicutes bacterium M10-2]
MIVIPAIDLLDGKPVRLYQGDYAQEEQVGEDAIKIAKQFHDLGAQYLHVVDLNGAKSGERIHYDLISRIIDEADMKVEVGGGIRSMKDIKAYLDLGVDRVILGTAALKDRAFLKEAVNTYAEKIAVGIDCKDGMVCASGWLDQSEVNYIDFAIDMENLGIKTIIFTDISKDGTLAGPNLDMLEQLKKHVSLDIIASGGVKDLSDIRNLAKLHVYGAIAGKSLYAKTLDLKEALLAAKEEGSC